MQNGSENLELTEASMTSASSSSTSPIKQIRIKVLQAASRNDDEMKAREGLFLLSDALEIAWRRLQAKREVRGTR